MVTVRVPAADYAKVRNESDTGGTFKNSDLCQTEGTRAQCGFFLLDTRGMIQYLHCAFV